MKHYLRHISRSILLFGSCIALSSQEADTPILFSIPPQIEKIFSTSPISKTHEFSCHVNPFYLHGDFNGDGKLDTVVFIKEKKTGKIGIAIFHGGSKKVFQLGAGKVFENPEASDADDMIWLNAWYVYLRGPVGRGVGEGRPPKLMGDGILAQKAECASSLIYWDGSKYARYQQGD